MIFFGSIYLVFLIKKANYTIMERFLSIRKRQVLRIDSGIFRGSMQQNTQNVVVLCIIVW